MVRRRVVLGSGVSLLLVVVIAVVGYSLLWGPNLSGSTEDPKIEALHRLETAAGDQLEITFQNGFPRGVLGSVPVAGENSTEQARSFLQEYRDFYRQNDPRLGLHVRRVSGEDDQFVLFYQTYLGIEVLGSEILVMVNGENVTATVGGLLPAGVVLDTFPIVEAPNALEIAKQEIGRPDAFVVGKETLLVYDPSVFEDAPSQPHLVWRIPVGPGEIQLVYVDAHSGEVLMVNNLFSEAYELDLEDANGYTESTVDCFWYTTADDWIGDEDGLLTAYSYLPDSKYAWLYIRSAYYFFANEYGRDSYDGDGVEIELYVFSGHPRAPHWVPGTGCDFIEFDRGSVSYDVMVHEYAHAVQTYTSRINHGAGINQAFALKESLADIQAMFADSDDWLLGDNRTGGGGYSRNIANPSIRHMDQYDHSGTKASGYENSGIPSYAAYLTSIGGLQDFWIGPALGRARMGHLYYGVMVSLPSNARFIDARNLAMAIAAQHFTPEQVCTVQNAWALVGVGTADVGCDGVLDPDLTDTDDDYTIDTLDNCPTIFNPYQEDFDGDGAGDACDWDDDNDDINDNQDNCPWLKNPKQMDTDKDGKGDPCDDEDADGVIDVHDNCPFVSNSNQLDHDDDGVGDVCDLDLDGDGVNDREADGLTILDNCLFEPNPDQADSDGDGIGDVCDGCPNDADTNQAYTAVDPFLLSLGALPKPYQPDSDGDGIPDACDPGISIDDLRVHAYAFSLEPDRMRHKVQIQADPGSLLKVPIPVCDPLEPGRYLQNTRGRFMFEDLDENVGVWLGDAAGFSAGKLKNLGNGQFLLEFVPRGGMEYFLMFGFYPESAGQQSAQFSMVYDCYARLEKAGPTAEDDDPPELFGETLQPSTETQKLSPTEETPTIEPTSRCDLFEGGYPLTLLDIPFGSTALTLYIEIPGGVPGLEADIPGDDQPWEYSARLGATEADRCAYQGYAQRLYCDFVLPETYLDTVQELVITVNGCDQPVFQHARVSIFAPQKACAADLNEEDCTAAGGTMTCGVACYCQCP